MSGATAGMFPLFAARFLKRDEEVPHIEAAPSKRSPPHLPPSGPTTTAKPSALRHLDLGTLPRDDGPPTELRTRKEKLAHYEQQCSFVGDRLFVGGEVVARSLEILQQSNITHVINCVGFLYPPYFEGNFAYQTLYLQDTPAEDIIAVLYDVFDFIDSDNHGKIFIHCSQGVSRSTTLAIAYRMWRENRSYEDVFAEVKQMRGVANPNIGFICQLLQWHKRRTDEANIPRLYRLAPQSPSAPLYLVPKAAAGALDPRGSFVLHSGSQLFVWTGESCPEAFDAAALRFAGQLHRYEGAPALPTCIRQGKETEEFWRLLEAAGQAVKKNASTPPPGALQGAAFKDIQPVPAYDRDYDVYARAIAPSPSAGTDSPLDSARSGRKTPRVEGSTMPSPNDRFRKQARSEALERERERSARSSGSSYAGSYGLGSESARNRALDFQELAVRRRAPSPPTMRPLTGRPPLTPRGSGGNDGAMNAQRSGSGGIPSRLGIPKLALSKIGVPSGSPGNAGGAVPSAAAAKAPSSPSASSSTLSDSEDDSDDDVSTTTATTTDSDHSDVSSPRGEDKPADEGGEEGDSAKPPPARPPAVPRLNLGK